MVTPHLRTQDAAGKPDKPGIFIFEENNGTTGTFDILQLVPLLFFRGCGGAGLLDSSAIETLRFSPSSLSGTAIPPPQAVRTVAPPPQALDCSSSSSGCLTENGTTGTFDILQLVPLLFFRGCGGAGLLDSSAIETLRFSPSSLSGTAIPPPQAVRTVAPPPQAVGTVASSSSSGSGL
ncbi:UNVERIFIED_CONTAM: hypothetical protein FKN15_016947 [Acipenser sinensis]